MAAPLVSRPSHDVTAGRPPIEWYPGHIAKAERLMTEVLSMVDVVVELRDARIPDSTAHPMLASWIGSRGHILALNRMDAAPAPSLTEWAAAMGAGGQAPVLIDAKKGGGVAELKREILRAGAHVNARLKRRGINPRPVRAAVLGYPNVGKSALINRLVGRRKAKSENRPGVTRGFSWVRIDSQVQLLDSPGIIPAKQVSQRVAYRLAMCDDIGAAAYDPQAVASALLEVLLWLQRLSLAGRVLDTSLAAQALCSCGEEYVAQLAEERFTGDVQRAATTLLKDFRSGSLGRLCLEWPAEGQGEER
ncbi:GTP binding protein [Emiliania huxleyi CCMP1516]|uniref:Mitochondrial GTPase 1 n=2 Tax=Emiliania huxleyi TaxID=2903 RepID=A0A0D3J2D0_EMIH1|nr:hypothetical protein EMIHUDRAFT_75715 [Emiliania huxleyi CCMP1516]XP_005789788.1 GTP binding protein [Emiliania huxleyi CCMP1516]EOD17665.1 hypothetical protein EMIHUDRAFT_75715 [Emiliania huxleyi CCMP1516]EOD37359.1 GTP binding protein [Emiliania huxleyi CCMP1516]|eukprot:XP_005770094.1 hypothetical protein EMIHUDRAFT_75715 [Emiliania huxleyi CCMP1516]